MAEIDWYDEWSKVHTTIWATPHEEEIKIIQERMKLLHKHAIIPVKDANERRTWTLYFKQFGFFVRDATEVTSSGWLSSKENPQLRVTWKHFRSLQKVSVQSLDATVIFGSVDLLVFWETCASQALSDMSKEMKGEIDERIRNGMKNHASEFSINVHKWNPHDVRLWKLYLRNQGFHVNKYWECVSSSLSSSEKFITISWVALINKFRQEHAQCKAIVSKEHSAKAGDFVKF